MNANNGDFMENLFASEALDSLGGALPDLVLVLSPLGFCCLPVTRIWQLLFLHYRDNAKLKCQFLLPEVRHSNARWALDRRALSCGPGYARVGCAVFS
jgi:hypothetical protein